jgi:K+-transporting ATPase ATPase C chain
MKDLLSELRPTVLLVVIFTVLCGVAYPALTTGVAQVLFPHQADGAEELVAQTFTSPGYFWGRPSAVAPGTAMTSSGFNHGPTHPALRDAVAARVEALRAADPGNDAPVPVDLVTASGSGLDPHISPAAALYQVPRVARARGLDEAAVRALVERRIEERTLGVLGERRVNVLLLNRALDVLAGGPPG